MEKKQKKIGERFEFPEGMERVTAGHGGEAVLIIGDKKTVLFDCGMAYCHEKLIANIETALNKYGRKRLDYIILSHSHYDHIGALPYLLLRWPEAIVFGARKCKDVFKSKTARKVMKSLGESARDLYGDVITKSQEIITEPLRVDVTVGEGDEILIGEEGEYCYFSILETKGHTDCSLTFILEPMGLMFASESTGLLQNRERISTAMLKSCKESIESAYKCKEFNPKKIMSPHYGLVEDDFINEYFDLSIRMMVEERDFVVDLYKKHKGDEEKMLSGYKDKYWEYERERNQPIQAFMINAVPTIKAIIKEYIPYGKY